MNNQNNIEKNAADELLEEVAGTQFVKMVSCSFYSTEHYTASHFYKLIANC